MSNHARIALFDILRGFTIVSMVAFHATYDLVYIFHVDIPWFGLTLATDVWRCSISWTFLLLAGWMTSFSRNNMRRAAIYGAAALTVFLVTTVAAVDTPISFGILFCMAACTLTHALLQPLLDRINPSIVVVVALMLFAATYQLPRTTYSIEGLAWLGFPSASFTSGDYYPIIPYFFMYEAGAALSRLFAKTHPDGYPSWMERNWCPPLATIGNMSLPIYLIHQPAVLVILTLIFGA